jgi:multidrug efflux pump subunit AcrA (membrane-fusion protein)
MGLPGRRVWTAAALASLAACRGGTAGPAPEERRGALPAVEAVRARSGRLPLEERLHGVVKAQNQVTIRAEIAAKVVEVLVRSGDPAQKGQVQAALARTVIGGLTASTLVTLVLVPAAYTGATGLGARLQAARWRWSTRRREADEEQAVRA